MTGRPNAPEPHHRLFAALRAANRAEIRASRAADEHIARVIHERGRSLSDVVATAAGNPVVMIANGVRLEGTVVACADDLVTLALPDGRVAQIRLDAVQATSRGGTTGSPTHDGLADPAFQPRTFVAALRQVEMAATPVDVFVAHQDHPIAGVLTTVARDHVVVATPDGTELAIAHDTIGALVSGPDRRSDVGRQAEPPAQHDSLHL